MHSRYPTPRSAALLLALALSAASAAEPRYDVLDLRTLGFSDAFALNNLGHVAGRNESGEVLLWNGSTVSSTSLDSATPAIMDLNDLGSIVGTYTDPSLGEDFAFVLTAGELTKLQGFDVASAINNRGQIVLNSFGGSADAFIYQNGTSVALGSLGGTDTFPAAINTSGAVVGGSTPVAGSEHQHAFLYHNGSTTDLGTLGGQRSSANDINDAGNIVGHSYGNTEEFQAVIYTVGRALPLIPHQPGTNSSGLKINNYNVIAGHLPLAGIWSGGVLKLLADFADFESFGVRPAIADFNDRGQILVRGWMRDPIMRSIPLLLTPRPTPPARLTALAARSIAGANDQTSIAGFVVAGNSNGSILLRTVGPGLTPLGVTNAAADPAVKIFNSANTVVAANDNWSADESAAATLSSTATRLGAQPLAADSADAALLADLPAGAYTAHASNPADPSRIVLTEIYDAGDDDARLTAASIRLHIGTGESIGIVGFALAGEGPAKVLLRALGPDLATRGVANNLADPQLWLYRGSTPVLANDDWGSADTTPLLASTTTQVGLSALPDASKDAALLVQLEPGAYTLHVSGTNNSTGIALVEVYLVPDTAP